MVGQEAPQVYNIHTMKEVTVVEDPRGRGFWFGLFSGLVAMVVVAIILWFMGLIDIFPQDDSGEQNNNALNVTSPVVNEPDSEPTNVNATDNTTLDEVSEDIDEMKAEELAENPFFVDAVLAKNIDANIKPVEETSEFAAGDKRVYVIVTLDASVSAGTNVGVEWNKEGKLVSDFDTDVTKGQTLAYFYFPPSGAGEYSVKILIDGVAVEELKFSVAE